MIELMFVEVGAVVAEILDASRCTIQPYCNVEHPPTYEPADRIEMDLARSLESTLSTRGWLPIGIAALGALYDQYDPIDGQGSASIGPSWPGGNYEGVVSIRENVVKSSATLAAAAASLPGHPWEYQVVTSIDESTGAIRRYHGFHAEIIQDNGEILVLQVSNGGRSADPSSPRTKIQYDPTDAEKFYAGALVAEQLVRGGQAPRNTGAVFMTLEAAAISGVEVPKLPPSAGL